ncbi:centrosomal protein of 55 kDa [Antennarius striatus]|uniref:centrosomal protein of 55 kDa n=1 Tax=Antennarius striatus TaxID=241820 RepID=UPI0035B2038F
MTSKGAKETIVNRLGFKSNSSASKAEAELDRIRKENAHLKRKIDDLSKRHVKPPDSDKTKLLERILSLETLRERNNQQLLVKEQEVEMLRQQLTAKGGEVVSSLQLQLEQRRKEAEQRDMMFQNLSQETENLKSRCQSLEAQVANGQALPGDLALVQDQLRDALEKNKQWLTYDQQREVYVQSVLARSAELEQQLGQAKQQQTKAEATSDVPDKDTQLKNHCDQLLLGVQKDLETQKDLITRAQQELSLEKERNSNNQAELQSRKERTARLQEEMSALQRRYDEKCGELSSFLGKYKEKNDELDEVKMQLQAERLSNRHEVLEEKKVSSEQVHKMTVELESMEIRLEEEKKRSADLLLQVNMLQKSLLSQNEEQRRIAALEQQISAKDFENEKIDRQTMQHQLHKVLKELRKARDQISKLESAKQTNTRFSEPSSYSSLEFDGLTISGPRVPTSPPKVSSLLDESFLECPKCQTPYPASRHRELLVHIDYCLA